MLSITFLTILNEKYLGLTYWFTKYKRTILTIRFVKMKKKSESKGRWDRPSNSYVRPREMVVQDSRYDIYMYMHPCSLSSYCIYSVNANHLLVNLFSVIGRRGHWANDCPFDYWDSDVEFQHTLNPSSTIKDNKNCF